MTRHKIILVVLTACALPAFWGCEDKDVNLLNVFRKPAFVDRLNDLRPKCPPGVRRESAYWFLKHTHKLTDRQRQDIGALFCELLLKDSDRLVRGYSASTLGQLRDPRGISALTEALAEDKDPLVRCDVVKAIAAYEDLSLIHELARASQTDRDADVRQTALAASVKLGGKQAIPSLIDALSDRDTNVGFSASQYLTQLTGQNLGRSQDTWRKWWAQNAQRVLAGEPVTPAKADEPKEQEEKEKGGEEKKQKKKRKFLFF